jgi:hypothetical protein
MPLRDNRGDDRPTPPGGTARYEPSLRRLPEAASIDQIVFAYNEAVGAYARLAQQNATLVIECHEHMTIRDKAVEAVSDEVVILGATMRRLDERVGFIERRFFEPESMKRAKDLASIPPMRPEADSSHELAEALGKAVGDKFEEEIHNPGTPSTPSPETVAKIAEETAQQIISRVKNTGRHSVEAERIRSRRNINTVIVITTITTLGAIVTALAEHFSAPDRHREAPPALVLPPQH